MKVAAYVHRYPPDHNAGAEWMLHHTLKYLQGQGHEIRVLTSFPISVNEFDGIPITSRVNLRTVTTWFAWADVCLTHLDQTRQAVSVALRRRKPLVHFVHNRNQLAHHRVTPAWAQLVVFNSRHLSDEVAWAGSSTVLYPPVPPDAYRTDGTGDRVLLSNLIAAKGSLLVYAVAAELPEVPFLLVRGAYGHQEEPPPLENVEVVRQDPDMRRHYARTKLVLMPSSYESWGRVAVEAACSGIPTIASYAAGLVEALEGVGTYLDVDAENLVGRPPPWGIVRPTPETVKDWAESVELWLSILDGVDAGRYREQVRRRAEQLWASTLSQLSTLEKLLLDL